MSLGGSAHESLLSIKHSKQPSKTIELSKGENGLFIFLLFKIVKKIKLLLIILF